MSKGLRILCVITARGGSKGVPRKNIRLLAGKPLIVWTIETALSLHSYIHGVVVSTDDEEIANVSRSSGADVPFCRPAELASDSAKSLPVLQHATHFVESRDRVKFDWILLLQPTTPFRTPSDILECIDLATASGSKCDSVVSVAEMAPHPIFAKRIDEFGMLAPYSLDEPEGLRRQDVSSAAYVRNGAIYLTRRDVLIEKGSIYGQCVRPYVMPAVRSINIDSELDWMLAEAVASQTEFESAV